MELFLVAFLDVGRYSHVFERFYSVFDVLERFCTLLHA